MSSVEDINLQDHTNAKNVKDFVNTRKDELDATRKMYQNMPQPNDDCLSFLSQYFDENPKRTTLYDRKRLRDACSKRFFHDQEQTPESVVQ